MCTGTIDKQDLRAKNGDVEANYPPPSGAKPELLETSRPRTLASFLRRLLSLALRAMFASALVVLLVAALWFAFGLVFVAQLVVVAAVVYLAAGGGYRWFYVAFVTGPRDLSALLNYIRFLLKSKNLSKNEATVASEFTKLVLKNPKKIAFYFEETEWTRLQVEEMSNRVANLFAAQGLKKGDSVALLMTNRPEFVCIWMGLSKIGVITALINTNLRLKSLIHCIKVADCKSLIFSENLLDAVKEISSDLVDTDMYCWSGDDPLYPHSELAGARLMAPLLASASTDPPQVQDQPLHHDRLVYIYTSGTTGLPKAAVISNSRYLGLVGSLSYMIGINSSDITYTCLPLYHTAGGCLGAGQALVMGGTTVIRTKFSASNYFPDIYKYKCTVAQYIGEMCRYLLSSPKKPEEKTHNLRLIVGNGLRPQIWKEFVQRFNIPRVGEFYGATEGNANIINNDNTEGAIGFISRIIPSVYPISIIKVDEASGEPVRNSKGLCQACKPGEPGAFIGKILPNNPTRAFLGYVNAKESEKKVIRDVFKKGDSAFISGDILDSDELGYLYFRDRTGDTFRWKGENVSTAEVEGVVSNIVGYKDCVVYGVQVSGCEGRAGMAAIVDPEGIVEIDSLSDGIKKVLPNYARPMFIRITRTVEMTGTYKMKKMDLQKDGYDPSKVKDKLYYLSLSSNYEPLDNDIFSQIESGKIRL